MKVAPLLALVLAAPLLLVGCMGMGEPETPAGVADPAEDDAPAAPGSLDRAPVAPGAPAAAAPDANGTAASDGAVVGTVADPLVPFEPRAVVAPGARRPAERLAW